MKRRIEIPIIFFGVLILGVGIALMRYSNQGTDPFVTMNIGISHKMAIDFGTIQMFANLVLLIVMAIYMKRLIHLGTFLGVFVVGYLSDYFFSYIHMIPVSGPIQLISCVVGLTACCFGAALYMSANLGISPYDALGLIIQEKLGGRISFRWIRIFTDMVCVLIGFVFGAPIGVGTLITAFFTGPLIDWFKSLIERVLLLGKKQIT